MNSESETLLRLPVVLQRTGLSRSSLYAAIGSGAFPKPIALSERCRAWPASVVSEWIARRIAAGTK